MRNEAFGRLLKGAISSIAHYEGKIAPIVEDDLGHQIGVTAASIQRYKAGHLPPEPRTIEILGEAAVKRGYLNREWLEIFLRAAHHPAPEKVVDKLCPISPVRQHPARVYENLPAPTYNQFVMRRVVFDEVIDGLQQRSAVVLIASMGGMGKTSLAREVATQCLKGELGAPLFDAVVWVSDKDRPGTTSFSIVLDEIARTLDYPGFTQYEHEEKRREVEQLLRRQKVLLLVDNFETISDGVLLSWLLRLPEPSKAIVTTREYSRAFRNNTYVLDLRGMTEAEAQQLINQRRHFLKIEKLIPDAAQLESLVATTGGNPKAIEMALGLIKHERRPLQEVVEQLYAVRGELFEDLFARAWSLLDEASRRVLLATTFFSDSANAAALASTADVQGFAFDRSIERLLDLALLDAQQVDLTSPARYLLHPLVRAFAQAQLRDQPEFEAAARERWLRWYKELAANVSFCWDNLTKLKLLDPEQETISTVLEWAFENRRYSHVIQIYKEIRYYFDVRGLWDQCLRLDLLGSQAARFLSNTEDEVEAVAYSVDVLCRQNKIAQTEQQLLRLRELKPIADLSGRPLVLFYQAFVLYWRTIGNIDDAEQACQELLSYGEKLPKYGQISAHHWLGSCLLEKGDLAKAWDLFSKALGEASEAKYQRSITFNHHRLAMVALAQGALDLAEQHLKDSLERAQEYSDRRYIGLVKSAYGCLYRLRGDIDEARRVLTEAIDLFERLGMRRDLVEAREEVAKLEITATATANVSNGSEITKRAQICLE